MMIERREGESNERFLSRFRLMVQRAGVLREYKRRRHFVSKSELRRKAHAKARRRARRNAERSERASRHR
jgi:small subunit ribosomal protein S21